MLDSLHNLGKKRRETHVVHIERTEFDRLQTTGTVLRITLPPKPKLPSGTIVAAVDRKNPARKIHAKLTRGVALSGGPRLDVIDPNRSVS